MNGHVIQTLTAGLLAFLAWQIFTNANRLTTIEEDLKHIQMEGGKLDSLRADVLNRLERLEGECKR